MNKTWLIAALLTLATSLSSTLAIGQDPSIQEQSIVVTATDDMEGGTSVMAFEMSDSDGAFFLGDALDGNLDFSMGHSANNFSMLNNPSVQQDLQLVDEQIDQIKQINKDFASKIKEQMGSMKDENGNYDFQVGANLGELIRDLQQQQQDQIASILLPNQQKRLEQVARQIQMKRMGTAKAITGKLAKELGITAEQKKNLRAKSKELKKELEEKMAELRAKAKQQLLEELTTEQKERLTDLLGEDFVQKKKDRNQRFRMIRPGSSRDSGDF